MSTVSPSALPSAWRWAQLGQIARITTGSADVQDSDPDGEYPFYVRSPEVLRLAHYTHDTEAILTAGDGNVGRIFHHARGRFAVHQRVYILEPGRLVEARYLYYVTSALFFDSLRGETAKSTVESLRRPMLTGFDVRLPSRADQRQIADYLDHETAEIDAFIGDLNLFAASTVARRSSYLATLTEAREGWRSGRLKSFSTRITDGAHISPVTDNGKHPFVSTRDIQDGSIDTENCLLTDEDSYRYMVQTGCRPLPGDILFSKDGTIGNTALVPEGSEFVVASSLVIVRPRPDLVEPAFLRLVLESPRAQGNAAELSRGAGLPRISIGNVSLIPVAAPGLSEQREIIERGATEMGAVANLLADIDAAMALAKERRAALITAAVTGQIDVTAKQKPVVDSIQTAIEEAR